MRKTAMAVSFLLLAAFAGVGVFCVYKPQPWYPRLRNYFFPPELAGAVLPPETRLDKLEVHKSERWLVAYAKGKPVKIYFVALSKYPKGHKVYEGDKRVPEGLYRIDSKNPHSDYHRNLGVSYPNERDKAVAAAINMPPGSAIKVHGLGPRHAKRGDRHWFRDWTAGCIAVTDAESEELYALTPVGIPIEILP